MPIIENEYWRYYLPHGAPHYSDPKLVGKWMLFGGEGLWNKVVSAMENGRITAVSAKTVPSGQSTGSALIAIYTSNYQDLNDVLRVGLQLRNEGLKKKTISYKLDAQTDAGVYGTSYYQLRGSSLVSTETQEVLLEAADLPEVPGQQEHAGGQGAVQGHGAAQGLAALQAAQAQQHAPAAAWAVAQAPAATAMPVAQQQQQQQEEDPAAASARHAAARKAAGEAAAARAGQAALHNHGLGAQPGGQSNAGVIDLTDD